MGQHYLMLLGLFVTVAGTAWYDREAQNPVLAAVALLALLGLWACYRLGPDREGDNGAEDEWGDRTRHASAVFLPGVIPIY